MEISNSYIPPEIIFEILKYIPDKNIYKFRRVSKLFDHLVRSIPRINVKISDMRKDFLYIYGRVNNIKSAIYNNDSFLLT